MMLQCAVNCAEAAWDAAGVISSVNVAGPVCDTVGAKYFSAGLATPAASADLCDSVVLLAMHLLHSFSTSKPARFNKRKLDTVRRPPPSNAPHPARHPSSDEGTCRHPGSGGAHDHVDVLSLATSTATVFCGPSSRPKNAKSKCTSLKSVSWAPPGCAICFRRPRTQCLRQLRQVKRVIVCRARCSLDESRGSWTFFTILEPFSICPTETDRVRNREFSRFFFVLFFSCPLSLRCFLLSFFGGEQERNISGKTKKRRVMYMTDAT